MHNGGVGFLFGRQSFDRGQIALKISTRKAKSGFEIAVWPMRRSSLKGRNDLRPVGADTLAKFRKRVGHGDRCHQTQLMEILASSALS